MKNKISEKQTGNNSVKTFERNIERYEDWFIKNHFAYSSELKIVKDLLPKGRGVEIGIGTGRFAEPLGIEFGVDPSIAMLEIARKRKISVIGGVGEYLPIADNYFDFVLITTTLCFLNDIVKTLKEIKRILRENGFIILGFIDRESFLGKIYMKKKGENPFYKFAKFYSAKEVIEKLKKAGFSNPEIKQTLFTFPEKLNQIDYIKGGYGEGGFVIIRMRKNREV